VISPPVKRKVWVRVEPGGEGAVRVAQREHAARVLDRGLDLQPVADDAGVTQEPRALAPAIGRDAHGIEAVVGHGEALSLLEDRQPRQARLIDLQHEAAEEGGVVAEREAVLAVVVRAMKGMAGRDPAVAQRVPAIVRPRSSCKRLNGPGEVARIARCAQLISSAPPARRSAASPVRSPA
jgi:hypothetical protein